MNASHELPVPSVRRTLFGASCLSLQPLALNVLSVPVMAYIIRQLGPEGFAQWMVATTLLAVGAALTNLGLRGSFVRSVAAAPSSGAAALAEQLGVRLLLSVLAGAMVVLSCVLLGYSATVLWCTVVGAAGVVLTTIATTLADLLQAHHRMPTIAAANGAAGLLLIGASLAAAWSGGGAIVMAAAYVTGPALSAVLLLVVVRRQVCPVAVRVDPGRIRRLLFGSRYFAVQQLLAAASAHVESLMLPRLIGMSQFGFFSGGAMLANRLAVLPDGLCTAAYPAMTRACSRDPRDGARLVALYASLGVGGAAIVALLGTLAAGPIGHILFPGRPSPFDFIVRVTIWSLPLVALEMVLAYGLNAAGRDRAVARASVPAAAVSLAAAASLVAGFGLTGACWSMVLRPAVRVAFLAPAALRVFGGRRAEVVDSLPPAHGRALTTKAA